jgi:hypothetical protein
MIVFSAITPCKLIIFFCVLEEHATYIFRVSDLSSGGYSIGKENVSFISSALTEANHNYGKGGGDRSCSDAKGEWRVRYSLQA